MKFPILRASMLLPAFLFVIALGLRAAWILSVPSKPVGDFAMYLESARHLLEHGQLDDQFIYMPGYVIFAAGVQALGGGWLAVKLAGATLAAVGAPLVFGITKRLWDHRAGTLAGVLYAVWPGGIAISSVTGTDIPAAVIVAAGVYVFVRVRPASPYPTTLAAGALFGLAAWVRAVALPLAPLSVFLLWAQIRSARRALLGAACATAAAALVLAPWAVRNHQRYGEWFFTDSHGGLTAMVGAYPNTDGQFTRALNRSFEAVTGIPWLGEPHRQADHWAYKEAQRWTKFEPWYAVGLGLMRAEKLLSNERSLLYWPLYRAGVLKPEASAAFERWRPEIEAVTDMFWWFLLLSCVAAVPLAVARRNWLALGVLPMQVALAGVYILYFSESRYHLPIATLAFPAAAGFWVFLWDEAKVARRRVWGSGGQPQNISWRTLAVVAGSLLICLLLWSQALTWGETLLKRHRWAVHVCEIEGQNHYCMWKPADEARSESPLQGAFSDVGLHLRERGASAELNVVLAPGPHVFTARLDVTGAEPAPAVQNDGWEAAQVELFVNEESVSRDPLKPGEPTSLLVPFQAKPGNNRILLRLSHIPGSAARRSLWLQDVRILASPP